MTDSGASPKPLSAAAQALHDAVWHPPAEVDPMRSAIDAALVLSRNWPNVEQELATLQAQVDELTRGVEQMAHCCCYTEPCYRLDVCAYHVAKSLGVKVEDQGCNCDRLAAASEQGETRL